jgi:putative thioredoxin
LADQGAWVLGRVDVDAQPQVAQALQTRAVPFAVAIINEQMVPLFEQPYPEAQIRMVIDKVLALASEQGVGSAPTEKIEPEEEEAIAALDAGDYATAEAAYKKLLARKPNDNFAILGLAQTQLMARTEGIDGAKVMKEASAHPDDIALQMQCADIEVASGYLEPAFARLLRLIPLFDGAEKKQVKDRLIELFALVDPADPRVIKARAALANALF